MNQQIPINTKPVEVTEIDIKNANQIIRETTPNITIIKVEESKK